ncbi:MAG: DinB family protein [Gemmatimonadota bacterium]|nr:DinB family protein [Gemmatimonadota bacterium]MDH5758804.1 DinB family protein [Gemmatimonadota bacterium]
MTASTVGSDFQYLFDRDLGRLAEELEAYPDDAEIWRVAGSIKNSAGTLALHMVGNLMHFVGAVLGETGYVRDREAEFGDRDVPRAELLRRIGECRAVLADVLPALSDTAFREDFPGKLPAQLEGATTHRFLLHLSGHFTWHLGQVDYHRRLLVEG